MNIRLAEPGPAGSNLRDRIARGENVSRDIQGATTPEGMCMLYLRAMLGSYHPEYINRLYAWFRDREEKFQFYDPGEYTVLPQGQLPKTGIRMRLQIERKRNPHARNRRIEYEDVIVEFTFQDLEELPEPDPATIPTVIR